ncbi:hypothetical protein PENTCL1PPCAC_26213, partial [Pristionchus entomophagus]
TIVSLHFNVIMTTQDGLFGTTDKALHLTKNSEILSKEIVHLLSSLAKIAPEAMCKYYDQFIAPLKTMLYDGRRFTISCISFMGLAVGSKRFSLDTYDIMGDVSAKITNHIEPHGGLIMDFDRLVSLMGPDAIPFLPALLPPILRAARGEDECMTECACGTSGREEAAMGLLNVLEKRLKDSFTAYVLGLSEEEQEVVQKAIDEGGREIEMDPI